MSSRRVEKILWPAGTALVVLVAWHLAVRLTRTTVFPSPLAVALGFR